MILLSMAATLAACSGGFKPQNFANPEALFRASLLEYQAKHWENAQIGFERLTNDLSARDPLLAPAFFYLAMSHEQRGELLLAAQAFQRVTDGFPDDTLAPGRCWGWSQLPEALASPVVGSGERAEGSLAPAGPAVVVSGRQGNGRCAGAYSSARRMVRGEGLSDRCALPARPAVH
ncbi:MAG: tetratricopeptide repeat protein [Gemmatimonadaceae bacterium]|nr:tetratricopeptide repeat protein [Gemmatimonadaceae bacterium]